MIDSWTASILIILFVTLALLILHSNGYTFSEESKYLASAIGLSGFIVAVMGDGLFVN